MANPLPTGPASRTRSAAPAPVRAPAPARKSQRVNGASWELDPRGGYAQMALDPPRRRKRAAAAPPDDQPQRRSKRVRAARAEAAPAGPSKKRKRGPARAHDDDDDDDEEDDAAFLRLTRAELESVRDAKRRRGGRPVDAREVEVREMLGFLRRMRGGEMRLAFGAGDEEGEREGWELSVRDAGRLLRSGAAVERPVFVRGGGVEWVVEDEEEEERAAPRRPIARLFDWFGDDGETFEAPDLEYAPADDDDTEIPTAAHRISDMRDRFLSVPEGGRNADVAASPRHPWNFPELPLTLPPTRPPRFLQQPASNLVRNLLHEVKTVGVDDVCGPGCKNRGARAEWCGAHQFTAGEVVSVQAAAEQWLGGTVMLGEGGALTAPHCDSFSFGTVISLAEGAVGLGWLPGLRDEEREGGRVLEGVRGGRWCFRVLRAKDAVYMPPGTAHLVFRRPGGGQTLGLATRVLRAADLRRWAELFRLEMRAWVDGVLAGDEPDPNQYKFRARALSIGTRRMVDLEHAAGLYGGEESENQVRHHLDAIDAMLAQLEPAPESDSEPEDSPRPRQKKTRAKGRR